MLKIDIRKSCKICGRPLRYRQRTFCSKKCRNKSYSKKYHDKRLQRERENRGKYSEKKLQCQICGRWYVQVGSHVIQAHGFENAREYKQEQGFDVKRGIVPDWFRKEKGEMAIENGTYKNLKLGKKYWFTKGSKVAGRYVRSKETLARLRKQGQKIGKKYGG